MAALKFSLIPMIAIMIGALLAVVVIVLVAERPRRTERQGQRRRT